MRDYFFFLVLPALLPPAVGAWKGTKWAMIALIVSSLLSVFPPMGVLGVSWLAGTIFGAALVFFQWIAIRFGSRPIVEEQDES